MVDLVTHGRLVLVALARRRLALAVLIALPVVFYLTTDESVGRSVRALAFGVSWAVSTVAFFAAASARGLEPRVALAGRSAAALAGARVAALAVAALALVAGYWLLVVLGRPVGTGGSIAVDFAVTAGVGVAVGTAIGALVPRELDGSLVLFLFAGLQAVANPFDAWTRFLPFWSSRELGTWAIDGPTAGSLAAGLVHAAITIAACGLVVAVASMATGRRQVDGSA